MADKNNEKNSEIDSSNIFDDFAGDSNLIEEVDKLKKEKNKDKFFYISKIGHTLQTSFWLLFFVLIILFAYIYIQNDKEFKNSNLLDPLCFVFIGDIENTDSYCSSISSLKGTYLTQLKTLQETNIKRTLDILEKLFEIENFTKTKEVIFLTDKSDNKLKVLTIIEEFDNIKNEFDKIDKQKIQCKALIIDGSKDIFSMSCTAFSAGFEKGLRGFDGSVDNTKKGTSLSIANSFLNFIQKKSDFFTIIDRQKIFRSESTIGDKSDFTNSTTFNIKLKYNLK